MKILADTNIIISALLYPTSKPALALLYAAKNHQLVFTDYNITELRRVAGIKFPDMLPYIDVLFAQLKYELIAATPVAQKLIEDPKDAPILDAAIKNGVDIIISGDKHFLQLDITHPKILTVTQFLDKYGNRT